ncbi:group III truncated hemoglobin [Reyranella sp.]|uniref:group III truncated hemoglobin n=1 Tax=Reyranella sp. TaxID=1929291 RepID=UPI003D0BA5E6
MNTTSNFAEVHAQSMARLGLDEAAIHRLVHGFYAEVRQDALLGPIFASKIADWDEHLERMCRFWSSVAMMSGTYHGNPMARHIALPVDAEHFDRWLALFEAAATKTCAPDAAAHVIERARRIARSFELGIAVHAGALPARGQRFHRRTTSPVQQGDLS